MEKAASFLSSLLGTGGGGEEGPSGEPAATVASILIYPVKSCKGVSVPQAPVTATGFRWDRQWLVVNAKGRALTQWVEPKMALVEVELPPAAFDEDWSPPPSPAWLTAYFQKIPKSVLLNCICRRRAMPRQAEICDCLRLGLVHLGLGLVLCWISTIGVGWVGSALPGRSYSGA
ncbi:MOSC domain-containing protein 2, mitochondrial [Hordeum vulgare]|nr:MOSC domain-containing protein 2, mitochondrial [Hordeum vulgare]